MFDYHESYLHREAKHLLWKVCKAQEKHPESDNSGFKSPYNLPFTWRPNYGVFKELPFHDTDDPYYFECSEGLWGKSPNYELLEKNDFQHAFDPSVKRGKLLFVPDLTIFMKGAAHILIEVVHRNSLKPDKIEAIDKFFNGMCASLWTVDAYQLMCQTNKFFKPKFKRIL
jgi:hypothetical protein